MPYTILKAHWCGIVILNVHVQTEDESDVAKDISYKVLEHIFGQFRE